MSLISRGTRAAARPLRQRSQQGSRFSRRNASSHNDHAAHSESALHVESGATESEGFGKGFYVALSAIPLAYILYSVSSTQDNVVKRSYQSYRDRLGKKEAQDVLHAAALEQAIRDRAEIQSEGRASTRDLRFTEMFNQGSPWNVVAGEGTADMRKLEAYYAEQRKQIEEERVSRMNKR